MPKSVKRPAKRAAKKASAKRPADRINVPASMLPSGFVSKRSQHDFRDSVHWRTFRILAEFVDGWTFLADVRKSVTIFGSARFPETNHWYQEARALGRMLTDGGYSVVTGGGPGIMEAGNRGAQEGGTHGDSIGLNIKLPFETRANQYVEKGIGFHYFFVRKVMLAYSAQAYVYFPGGVGTLDEFTELVTLVQTKKMSKEIPIILVGKGFWTPFLEWIDKTLYQEYAAMSKDDLKLYKLVDTAAEAYSIIKKSKERKEFG